MDIINNRYKITEKLQSSIPDVEEFLAYDLWNKDRLLNLKIFSDADVKNDILSFFKDEFIIISSLDNHFHLKDYGFESLYSSLTHYSKGISDKKFYVCTAEHVPTKIPVLEFIKNKSLVDILKIIVQVCQALIYAGNVGFKYDSLTTDDVFIVPHKNSFRIRISDIASSKLQYPFSVHLDQSGGYVHTSESMEVLNGFIISLLAGKNVTANFSSAMNSVRRGYDRKRLKKDDAQIFECLYNIARMMLNQAKTDDKKIALYTIIKIINTRLKKKYPVCVVEPLKSVTFYPRIVGRGQQLQNIMQSLKSINRGAPEKNVFLVKGITGTGKTRFIKEAAYFLSLENVSIYPNYDLKKTSGENIWKNILIKLLSNFSYDKSMSGYLRNSLHNHKEIRNLFFEYSKTNPCFIIIDDIHLADDTNLDLLLYLALEVVYVGKIGLIFSYNETTNPKSLKFELFLKKLWKNQNVDIIDLSNLSEPDTKEMVKNVLFLKPLPDILGPIIHKQTAGNPFFIIELIKNFISQGLIYKESLSGKWGVTKDFYKKNTEIQVSITIKQAVRNQIKDLSDMELDILRGLSLFSRTFKIEYIGSLFNIPANKVSHILNNFLMKNIISEIKKADKIEYMISNKILQTLLYNQYPEGQKKAFHAKIAKILQKEKTIDWEELGWHFENAGQEKQAIRYYMKIASQNIKDKKINAAILQYEKILALVPSHELNARCTILLKIIQLCCKINERQKRSEIVNLASSIISRVSSCIISSLYYYVAANLYYDLGDADKVKFCLDKQSDIYTNKKSELIYTRICLTNCLYYRLKYNNKELIKNASIVIKIAGSKKQYIEYKAKAFILLGYAKYNEKEYGKAFKFFKYGKSLSARVSNIYDEFIALYNISLIYLNIYGYNNRTLKYTKKLLSKAKKTNIGSLEIPVLIDYAKILSEKQNNLLAYKAVKLAEKKADDYKIANFKFTCITALIGITKNLNEYGKMFEYKKQFEAIMRKEKKETMAFYSAAFYSILADAYQELNYNEKTYELLLKIKEQQNYIYDLNPAVLNFRLSASSLIQKKTGGIDALLQDFKDCMTSCSLAENLFDRGIIYKFLLNSVIMLTIRRPDIDFTPLIQNMLFYAKPKFYPGQKAYLYYLESYINKNEEKEYLLKALSFIKTSGSLYFSALLYIKLGLYYLKDGSVNFAIVNFLEAQKFVMDRIKKTPQKYKKYILSDFFYALPFLIVEDFINKKNIKKYDKIVSNLCLIEPKKSNKPLHLRLLDKDKKFKKDLISDLLKKQGLYEAIEDGSILQTVGLNSYNDMKTIMEFLAINLITQYYQIFIINEENELKSIFNLRHGNKYFNTVKALLQRFGFENILRVENEINNPCVIIPIKSRNIGYKQASLLGFMIFISESILTNISSEGLDLCKKYSNALAMLIENNKFKQDVSIDKLTGALTRKYLEIALKNLLKNSIQKNSIFSIILYDLDKFKSINDTYGHQTGDIVLKSVTQTILHSLNGKGFLGRYGGEEFIITLPGLDEKEAFDAAELFREKIASSRISNLNFKVTISLGIACYPKQGNTVNDLILNADTALYRAKKEGRNRSCVWSPEKFALEKKEDFIHSILIYDETKYMDNIFDLSDVLSLSKSNITRKVFLYEYAHKLIKIFEAENIAILLINKNNKEFKIAYKIGFKKYKINETLVKSVILNGMGIKQIDWDAISIRNPLTGIPEWNSVMIVPCIKEGNIIGLIYITVPEKKREFSFEDLNFLECLADIASANL